MSSFINNCKWLRVVDICSNHRPKCYLSCLLCSPCLYCCSLHTLYMQLLLLSNLIIGSVCARSLFSSQQTSSKRKPSGDSYTETGFLINNTAPAPGNPLGNPAYPGKTATGGPNWIDAATVTYNHSLVLTYNFAYSGATINGISSNVLASAWSPNS
jgi:hypothetical protein